MELMTCRDARYQLPDFVRGAIAAELAEEVSVHLAECPACRTEAADLKDLFTGLEGRQPLAQPSSTYWATVLPRVNEVVQSHDVVSMPEWVQRVAAPLAGAVVVAMFCLKVIPLSTAGSSGDLQASIQQFKTEELQEVAQEQVIAGLVEPVSEDAAALTSESDTEILRDLLADGSDHTVLTDLDHETLLQSLDDLGASDLVSILEEKKIKEPM